MATTPAAGPSRYAGQPTVAVPTADGGNRLMSAPRVAPAPPPGAPPPVGYDVRAGDRLDLLARAVYGDTTGWWRIADANPGFDATDLERPGGTIAVPGS
jgi:nucleoid-associated protein YgaU